MQSYHRTKRRTAQPDGESRSSPNAPQQAPQLIPNQRTLQRVGEFPAEKLQLGDLKALQHTIGNRATRHLLGTPSSTSPNLTLQREYDGALINYQQMSNEKDENELHTGGLKFSSLTNKVENFLSALNKGNYKKVMSALQDLQSRLIKDGKTKLKTPKKISKEEQANAATIFFKKWLNITLSHIEYLMDKGSNGVRDLQVAYGIVGSSNSSSKEKEEESSDEIIISNESSNFDFNNPPWEQAISAEVKSSGMGGAVIITFKGGRKIAVKSGGNIINNEILGSRMAREVGLETPDARVATSEENNGIPKLFNKLGANVEWGSPYMIIDFVNGIPITQVVNQKGLSKERVEALSYEMGRWYAFTVLNNDPDNFGDLTGNLVGVNTGNYFANGNKVVGIDQHTMGGDLKKTAFTDIKEGSPILGFSLGTQILKSLGNPKGYDPEALGDIVLQGAQEQMKHMAEKLDRDKIKELCSGLEVNKLDEIIDRVETIAESYN